MRISPKLVLFLATIAWCSCLTGAKNRHHRKKQKTDHNIPCSTAATVSGVATGADTTVVQTNAGEDHVSDTTTPVPEEIYEQAPAGSVCFMKAPLKNPQPTQCGTKVYRLRQFTKVAVNSKYSVGAENLAELLLARGDAVFNIESVDLDNSFICDIHLNELSDKSFAKSLPRTKKGGTSSLACGFGDIGTTKGTHAIPVKATSGFLTKDQSQTLMEEKAHFAQIGRPMCSAHYRTIQAIAADHIATQGGYCLRPKSKSSIVESPIIQSSLFGALKKRICADEDDNEYENAISDTEVSLSQEERDALKRKVRGHLSLIASDAGLNNVHFTDNFRALRKTTKQRRLYAIRKFMEIVFEAFASDDPEAVKYSVTNGERSSMWLERESLKLKNILTAVGTAFNDASSATMRLELLALVTPFVTLQELQNFIPGLTPYFFKESRAHAKWSAAGLLPDDKGRQPTVRYNRKALESFVAFISSSMVVQDLPFGVAKLKSTSGEISLVANMMRTSCDSRIAASYNLYLTETGQQHLTMSRSTYLKVLDFCTASTRKTVQGLDYITFNGIEAFSMLEDLVNTVGSSDDTDWTSNVLFRLKEAKRYLQVDFKIHLKESSRVADHCLNYAMSDIANPQLRQQCDHTHDLICPNCAAIDDVLAELFETIRDYTFPTKQEQVEALYLYEESVSSIREWKKHQVRTVVQLQAKSEAISGLKASDVFIICDWAMKWLPQAGTEPQSDFFGKRGLPWHVTVAVRRLENGNYVKRTYVHVFDQLPQDSNAVVAIIADVLRRIKAEAPGVVAAFLRSDNAGCYHCSSSLGDMFGVSERTGILVRRWDFSESQAGKDACDRAAASVKRNVRLYVAENHKCQTGTEFVQCIASYLGVCGTSAILGHVLHAGAMSTISFPGVTGFNNFEYDHNTQMITAWRGYKIGEGLRFPCLYCKQRQSKVQLETLLAYHENRLETETLSTDIMWKPLSCDVREPTTATSAKQDHSANSDDDDDEEGSSTNTKPQLFSCPEQGCVKKYQRYSSLIHHLELGNHKYRPERQTLRDAAVSMYSSQLESLRFVPQNAVIREAAESICPTADPSTVAREGWALKMRKSVVKFNENQKSYLIEKFNEGQRLRKKFDPKVLAKLMRRELLADGNLRFLREEYLSSQQIGSFWSRLAQKKRGESVPALAEGEQDGEVAEDEYFEDSNFQEQMNEVFDEVLKQKDTEQTAVDQDTNTAAITVT